jgi:hypothetical protein
MRSLLLAFLFLAVASLTHGADPETKRISILKSSVSLEAPTGWALFEKDGRTRLGPSEANSVEIAYMAAFEDDPKIDVTEDYLKRFLERNTQAKDTQRLPDGRLLGQLHETADSGGTVHRWNVIKATDKRNFALVLFTYARATTNPDMAQQILQVVKSVNFTPQK